MSRRPLKPCPRCSQVRQMHPEKPAILCRDCRYSEPLWPTQPGSLPVENPPCAESDPRIFDSINWETHREAKKICDDCPQRYECFALAQHIRDTNKSAGAPDGTWGGVLWSNGNMILRQPRRPKCGTDGGYGWHLRHGEEPCDPCRKGHSHAELQRLRRKARKAAAEAAKAAETQAGAA